ncbi:MAG: hypothetical protein ALAOOOJD_04311 [bacterium]|nr:hypothetical protein [bacterium]
MVKWLFFMIAGLVSAAWVLGSRNQLRTTMMLLTIFYVFPTGWIFYNYTGVLLVDFAIIAALGLGFAAGKPVRFFFKEISIPAFILILWMCITSTKALDAGVGYAEVSKWIRGYLIFVCCANFLTHEKDLRAAIYILLAGCAFESLLGVYQWRRGSLGLDFLGERLYRPEWWRAYGTFYVPSYFGNYLIMILPIALRLLIFYRPPQKKDTYYFAGTLGAGFLALYATLARGPWLSFLAVIVLMLLFTFFKSKLRPKVKWPIAAGIVLCLAFSLKYTDKILAQFGEERKTAALSRIYLGQVAWRLIQDNLMFGVGPGNYELNSPRYVVPIKEYPTALLSEMVHNTYLLIFSESGVIGITAFSLILIQMCLICFRMFRSNHGLALNMAIGSAMSIIAMIISFAASPDIHNEQTINQLFLITGIVFASELMERRHTIAQRQLQMRQRREAMQAKQNAMVNNGAPALENEQPVSARVTPEATVTPGPESVRRPWPPRRRT